MATINPRGDGNEFVTTINYELNIDSGEHRVYRYDVPGEVVAKSMEMSDMNGVVFAFFPTSTGMMLETDSGPQVIMGTTLVVGLMTEDGPKAINLFMHPKTIANLAAGIVPYVGESELAQAAVDFTKCDSDTPMSSDVAIAKLVDVMMQDTEDNGDLAEAFKKALGIESLRGINLEELDTKEPDGE